MILKSFDKDVQKRINNDPKKEHDFHVGVTLQKIGLIIADYRARKHLTQAQLAKLAHIPQPSVARIENGSNTSLSTLIKLSEAMKENIHLTLPA